MMAAKFSDSSLSPGITSAPSTPQVILRFGTRARKPQASAWVTQNPIRHGGVATMIDHIGLGVRDVARATEFYLKALAPLGFAIVMQVPAEATGHGPAIGSGAVGTTPEGLQSGKPSFWIGGGPTPSGPLHVA